MRILATILFTFLVTYIQAQTTNIFFNAADGRAMRTYDTTIIGSGSTWNARVTMPVDHDTKVDSTTALIMVVGLGEANGNWGVIAVNGWHYWLANGWDGSVTLPNGVHHPIIITLQPNSGWPAENITNVKLGQILTRYKIKRGVPGSKKSGIHVSGLSMGGWTWTTYVTGDAGSPYNYARLIASVAESCGANPNANTPYPNLFDQFAIYGNAGFGGNLLGFEQQLDGRDILNRVNRMNSNHAGSYYIRTNFGSGGHSNFNDHYNPSRTNWTTGSSNVTATTPSGGINLSMAQWQLLQGDTTLPVTVPPETIILNPISSFTHTFSHTATPNFSITSTVNQGVVTSWNWVQQYGPATLTMSNGSTSTVTLSNITQPGYYTFQVTASGPAGSDSKTVTVHIRDLMMKNVSDCRSGGGKKFIIGNVLSGAQVSTTAIYVPYVNRDLFFGELIKGGDTIVIAMNPNNGNYWNTITIGDFGGNFGCPITIMSDSVTKIGASNGAFRIGTMDSNAVAHIKLDGLANRLTKGVVYGFQYDRNDFTHESNSIALTINLGHHIEVSGYSVKNAGVGFFLKKNSDSTNPFSIYDNYRFHKVTFHDLYLHRINGEGFYIGHTDIAGVSQSGNNGRTVMGDSLTITRAIIDSTEWDGLQVSNFGYNAKVYNNMTYRTGAKNQSSQQWALFIGGNTQGEIYDNVSVNGTGPVGTLGKGTVKIYNNLVDSINNGLSDADGIYVSMSTSGMLTPVDSLIAQTYNNTISRVVRNAVFHANSNGAMKAGKIENNIYVGPVSKDFTSNASDVISGNTYSSSLNIDNIWKDHPAYRIYKMVKSNPGYAYSFWDLQTPAPPDVKPVGFRRGHKLKYKPN
ncbi:hypothetical protein ACFS6H_20110 [Terrimonas rubra]|uniref:Uncharacterized protein n=1 Tax=Terrimonas rubra TaxID=1035890 RepID=A0ABW6ABK5_9BACT